MPQTESPLRHQRQKRGGVQRLPALALRWAERSCRMTSMPPELLTSLQNPLIKRFRAAGRSRKGESFLLEGRHLLQEALNASWPLDAVLLNSSLWDDWTSRLEGLSADGKVFLAPAAVVDRVATAASPEGVLALARRTFTYIWMGFKIP